LRCGVVRFVNPALAQTEKGQHSKNDNNEANNIDNPVHGFFLKLGNAHFASVMVQPAKHESVP